MKGFPIFLLFIVTAWYSCKETTRRASFTDLSEDYNKGVSFMDRQNDSAFFYFNRVATSSSDTLQIAMAYGNMAKIQLDAGDYFGTQESALMSLQYLDPAIEYHRLWIAHDYYELGFSSLNLKNLDDAIRYFDKASEYSPDSIRKLTILNIKALAYQKQGEYQSAISVFESIIDRVTGDTGLYSKVLSNLARTKWLMDSTYYAIPEYSWALHLRELTKDRLGLNASYAHLSDYYTRIRPDSALYYAGKMYQTANALNSPDDQWEALQKLVKLSPAAESKKYFTRYVQLDDSLKTARAAAKNQFALIRYEVEKNKLENLALQKENSDKKLQLLMQRVVLFGTLAVAGLFAFLGVRYYRNRQQQVIRESQRQIRESKLKTSQKVHDVVANGLYRIMAELEHKEKIEKEELLDKIDLLYEQSRDISYEDQINSSSEFHETVNRLLISFAGNETKVLVVGNTAEFWAGVPVPAQKETEKILQELMVNMKKHSRAHNVAIRFERQVGQRIIFYTDDGVGLPQQFQYGNGLKNTETRIKSLNGGISFEEAAKGLRLRISFPIHQS